MKTTLRSVRGYISMGVGFIACPCHLPLTLPVLLSLIGGTTIGAWLSDNTTLVYMASTVLFLGGLALGTVWLTTSADKPKRQLPRAVDALTDARDESAVEEDCVACSPGRRTV